MSPSSASHVSGSLGSATLVRMPRPVANVVGLRGDRFAEDVLVLFNSNHERQRIE
jgi:hypothetical protein